MSLRRSLLFLLPLGLSLTSCANSLLGQSLQKSLEADPRLQAQSSPRPAQTVATVSPEAASAKPQLPADFPKEIPLYSDRELRAVVPGLGQTTDVTTKWVSGSSSDRVLGFYLQQLQTDGWQILEKPKDAQQGAIVARRNGLNLSVTVQPSPSTSAKTSAPKTFDNTQPATEFELRYRGSTIVQSPGSETTAPSKSASNRLNAGLSATSAPPNSFSDLDKAPKELRQYTEDLAKLGVLTLAPAADKAETKAPETKTSETKARDPKANELDPNAAISRRDYARWLFAANNRLYVSRPNLQLRSGSASQPAFQDVPRTDPDFVTIQGLAEAGIIPSPLSGDSTAVVFRPDAALSREDLVLWKVPLDTHQPLPTASLEAVQQTWGFEDTAKIAPRALRAILVDFQNGDQSNIRRAFGYTTILQPKKAVSRAQAAAALWHFGYQSDGVSAQEVLKTTPATQQGG